MWVREKDSSWKLRVIEEVGRKSRQPKSRGENISGRRQGQQCDCCWDQMKEFSDLEFSRSLVTREVQAEVRLQWGRCRVNGRWVDTDNTWAALVSKSAHEEKEIKKKWELRQGWARVLRWFRADHLSQPEGGTWARASADRKRPPKREKLREHSTAPALWTLFSETNEHRQGFCGHSLWVLSHPTNFLFLQQLGHYELHKNYLFKLPRGQSISDPSQGAASLKGPCGWMQPPWQHLTLIPSMRAEPQAAVSRNVSTAASCPPTWKVGMRQKAYFLTRTSYPLWEGNMAGLPDNPNSLKECA